MCKKRLLFAVGLFSLSLFSGCDYTWEAVDYCYDLKSCDPSYNKDVCIDEVEAEYNNFPLCEFELDDYYECVVSVTCGEWNAPLDCRREEERLNRCEAEYW